MCFQGYNVARVKVGDDKNFYGVYTSIFSSKKTNTDPNTKEN
jgi:hypothetical protein